MNRPLLGIQLCDDTSHNCNVATHCSTEHLPGHGCKRIVSMRPQTVRGHIRQQYLLSFNLPEMNDLEKP
jgi:hypothetical protein